MDESGNVIPNNEVSKIMGALSDAGITYWFDQEGVIHGEDFGEKILKYIKKAEIFVYLSTAAANDSEWTRKEIASAVEYKKKIIPVRIDDSTYHDSVMFRIVDLDYIKYASNPKKGREELVESILRYKAEEQAAAARREAEEQRRREEQERQYRQQEELHRRQQLTDELRADISKTEAECSELEKTVLLKQHDLGMVNLELESKRKHLEDQKRQMNAILYADDTTPAEEEKTTVAPQQPAEPSVFVFYWSHPVDSFRGMWQKIKETMHVRHWTLNVLLCLVICIVLFGMVMGFVLFFKEVFRGGTFLCAGSSLFLYALWQLLLNKRSGVGLLLLSPIFLLPVLYISGFNSHVSPYYFYFHSWYADDFLTFLFCLYSAIAFVLLFFLIRKEGKTAWSLLEGNFGAAFHMQKYAGYYVLLAFWLFVACIQLDCISSNLESDVESRFEKLQTDNNRQKEKLDSQKKQLDSMEWVIRDKYYPRRH